MCGELMLRVNVFETYVYNLVHQTTDKTTLISIYKNKDFSKKTIFFLYI